MSIYRTLFFISREKGVFGPLNIESYSFQWPEDCTKDDFDRAREFDPDFLKQELADSSMFAIRCQAQGGDGPYCIHTDVKMTTEMVKSHLGAMDHDELRRFLEGARLKKSVSVKHSAQGLGRNSLDMATFG